MVAISDIEANPNQPRNAFDDKGLKELAESIATHGIIQPITLRKIRASKYQIISGERRFRASQQAGLTELPAYVRSADDQSLLEMALVENIQREDLNPIDVGLSFRRLMEECDLTQESLAKRVGMGRSSVANHLRMLDLPETIQSMLRDGQLSLGHGKALAWVREPTHGTPDCSRGKSGHGNCKCPGVGTLDPRRKTQAQPQGRATNGAFCAHR